MDQTLLDFIQTIRLPLLDTFFSIFTRFGDHGEIWFLILIGFACFKKTRYIALLGFIALAIEFVTVNGLLKLIFQRPRPFVTNPNVTLLIPIPSGYSFPSGHSASSFAVASVLFFMKAPYRKSFLFLAALMAFSRVYLYVHYPSDILGGALIGMLIGYAVLKFAHKAFPKRWIMD